ncbi:MAG: hypothetical protein K2G26_05385, partial [Clostridia bacterium]|nr:hypothetical protein [Clostridia bacterium]
MNKVVRLLKYEWARLKAYKKWFAVLAAAVVIILAGIGVGFALKSALPISGVDKAATMQEYRQQLETDRAILQVHADELTDFEKFSVGREIEKLQFFIDTDTTESDYLSISEYTGKIQGYEAFGFCVYFFEYSSYFFIALAVAGALWAFSVETQVHSIKNLLAAPADRKSIFAVKTAVSAGAVLIVPVILFAVFLIVCACVPNGSFLIYAGGYKAVGGLHIFAQLGLRNILVILC